MPTLNADIPPIECLIRERYLYNLDDKRNAYLPCIVFSVASVPGRALGFQVMLDCGAIYERVPISALCRGVGTREEPLEDLQLWDCLGYDVAVHEYGYLSGLRCQAIKRSGQAELGRYLFTVDWYGSRYADGVGDLGHKAAHVIALDGGNFAALPNNRLRWQEAAFITASFPARPDWQVARVAHSCETSGRRWSTTDQHFSEGAIRPDQSSK
jgi:hypothetical protein